MAFDLFILAGIAGTVIFLAAYFANQQGWLLAEDWRYPLANVVAAMLILVSLITAWNLPAAIIEVIWAAISLYGLIKHSGRLVRSRRRTGGLIMTSPLTKAQIDQLKVVQAAVGLDVRRMPKPREIKGEGTPGNRPKWWRGTGRSNL